MQLSLHADYACRTLIYLAAFPGKKSSIEEIAKAFKISSNHLVKVAHRLGILGMIETTRGRGGGLSLIKDPSEINIGTVIRAMEPHFRIVECFDSETNTCPISGSCGLQKLLGQATESFLHVLDNATLANIRLDLSTIFPLPPKATTPKKPVKLAKK